MKKTDLLKQQGEFCSEEKNQDNKPYFERENVEETMFSLVTDENGTKITIGNDIVSEKVFENKNEAIEYIDSKPWELIVISSYMYSKLVSKIKEYEQNNQKNG